MKHTIEERHKIYIIALSLLRKDSGLCTTLYSASGRGRGRGELAICFPEIIKFRPKHIKDDHTQFWFGLCMIGYLKRKHILQEAIKATRPQSEKKSMIGKLKQFFKIN